MGVGFLLDSMTTGVPLLQFPQYQSNEAFIAFFFFFINTFITISIFGHNQLVLCRVWQGILK